MMNVVLGYIRYSDEKYLLAKRNINKDYGGLWEFQGGKIEVGETPEEAINREMKEEFGISVSSNYSFSSYLFSGDNKIIKFYPILCHFRDKKIHSTEHEAYLLLNINEIYKYELAPPDYKALKIIQQYDCNI